MTSQRKNRVYESHLLAINENEILDVIRQGCRLHAHRLRHLPIGEGFEFENLCSEVAARVFRSGCLSRLPNLAALKAYSSTVARNLIAGIQRKSSTTLAMRTDSLDQPRPDAGDDEAPSITLVCPKLRPDDVIALNDLERLAATHINRTVANPRHRQAIQMVVFQDIPPAEAAALTGLSPAAVWVALSRWRNKYRSYMSESELHH